MPTTPWERLEPILEELLRQPLERRRAWLEARCGNDHELLESVWRHHEEALRADGFLASPFAGAQAAGEGDRVGAYTLLQRLGSGGMGEVWLAERDDEFRRRVALKVIKRGLDTDEVIRRFRRERQLLADLDHPGIVRLLDGGATEDGRPYLVLELVEGAPLDEHLRAADPPIDARVELFVRVAEAVASAHELGVVHRDLKPSNVLVNEAGEPKVLDFGIAKVLSDDGPESTLLTRTGQRLLTPRYAAPEQVKGAAVSPATDVYALGVMLYELLCGEPPYRVEAGSLEEIESAVCDELPRRPSGRCTGTTRRRVAGDLDVVVLRALAKEPERRYRDAGLLAADLRRHLDGLPIRARPDTASYRIRKFVRRNRRLVLGSAAFVLLLVAALVTTLALYRSSVEAQRESEWLAYTGHLAAAESALRSADVALARHHLSLAPAALRDWEWRHLGARTDRSLRRVSGQFAPWALALDQQRGRVAVQMARDARMQIALLDLDTLEPVRWLPCRDLFLKSLALSSDGRWLAGAWGARDPGLVIDLETGESRLLQAADEASPARVVAFHPTDGRLFAGLADGRLLIQDPGTGEALEVHDAHEKPVTHLAFTRDGSRLATGSFEGEVGLWNVDPFERAHDLPGHTLGIQSLEFDPSAARLVSAALDGTLRTWDTETGAQLLEQDFREGPVVARMLADASLLVSTSDGGLFAWDVESRAKTAAWYGQDATAGVAVDTSRERAYSLDGDSLVEWSLETTDVTTLPVSLFAAEVAFDSTGGRLATCGPDGHVRLFETREPEALPPFEKEPHYVLAVDFHPQLDRVAALNSDRSVTLWDTASGERVRRSPPAQEQASGGHNDLRYDASGGRLLRSTGAPFVDLLDGEDLELVRRFAVSPEAGVMSSDLRADGTAVAAGTLAGAVHVWDAGSGEELLVLETGADEGGIYALAFHPRGDRIVAALRGGDLCLWSLPDGRLLGSGTTSQPGVDALAFHPDGDRLAVSAQRLLEVWQVEPLRPVVALHGHTNRIASLEFSPAGDLLASCGDDATLRIWDAPAAPPQPAR